MPPWTFAGTANGSFDALPMQFAKTETARLYGGPCHGKVYSVTTVANTFSIYVPEKNSLGLLSPKDHLYHRSIIGEPQYTENGEAVFHHSDWVKK